MNTLIHPVEIGIDQLLICLVLVMAAGLVSILLKLKLEKDLLLGTIRTFAQLLLVGYILGYIFRLNHPVPVLAYYGWMIFWAAQAVRSRTQEQEVQVFTPTFISMIASYMVITIMVTRVIIQVEPWYQPQYFLTLGGMIIGNSMTAISIAVGRLLSDIRQQRQQVELALSLGATYREATQNLLRDAIQAGMIPSINALMTVGLVSLPGMMTGQILAGQPPTEAIRYQIIVMLMIVASVAIGCVVVVHIIRRLCFNTAHQLQI